MFDLVLRFITGMSFVHNENQPNTSFQRYLYFSSRPFLGTLDFYRFLTFFSVNRIIYFSLC